MSNIDNRMKLEHSILRDAEEYMTAATRWADKNNLEGLTEVMAQLSELSARETRGELILDSLEKVHCLTDLLDYDRGLSKRGQDCLRKIRYRAHILMEALIEPHTPSAKIIPLETL